MYDVNNYKGDSPFDVIIYMQLNYLKLCLKVRLLFHYVYLAKLVFGGIPNTLNGKKNRGLLMEKKVDLAS